MTPHSGTTLYEPPTSPRPLLTIADLARLLAVDRKTVYRLPIPYVIVGQRRRFRPDDIDEYLERQREGP